MRFFFFFFFVHWSLVFIQLYISYDGMEKINRYSGESRQSMTTGRESMQIYEPRIIMQAGTKFVIPDPKKFRHDND